MNAIYRYTRGEGLLRGLNLNAPVDGVRPSPEFANVIQVVGDGRSRQHAWNIGGQTNFPQELGRTARRWDFRRFNFFGNYTLAWNENNVDGAFSVPATGDLDLEWGNAPGHAKHRFNGRLSHAGVQRPGHAGEHQRQSRHDIWDTDRASTTTAI